MSRYNAEFPFPIAFPPASMDNVLAEWLSKKGLTQCHVAETEKYVQSLLLDSPLVRIGRPDR